MDARKGGDVFFILTIGTHHSIYPATKRTKPFEDNSAKERGETFFHKIPSFRALPRLANKSSLRATTRQEGGRRFFKNHPNERRLGQQQITSKKVLRQEKTKAGGETFFSKSPTTVLLSKPRVQICLTHHTTRHLEGCTTQGTKKDAQKKHLEGCTPQGTSKDAHQNTSKDTHHKAPRRMHIKTPRRMHITTPRMMHT